MLKYKNLMTLPLAAIALGAFTAESSAGTVTTTKEVLPEEKPESVVSGTLSLQANTHFISYGADVWGAGTRWNDFIFNPSIELGIKLGSGFSLIMGTWWDVNDNADSNIGDSIQEVDVWGGFSYNVDKLTFTLLYQAWFYGSDTEHIIDLKIAYANFLNPSFLIHARPDAGASGGEEGFVFVLGVSPGFEAGPVTFSFPVNVAFMTDGFHRAGSPGSPGIPAIPAAFGVAAVDAVPAEPAVSKADGGFGYVSAGVSASVPLPFLPGDWSFGVGATYYYTSDDVIPNNRDNSFVTGSAGLTLTF